MTKAEFRHLTPAQAWEEAERRSIAIGVAGWVVVASLQAAGAVPTIYRPTLAPASVLVSAFLTSLALFVAHYHSRWRVGAGAAVTTLCLPYALNLLWILLSHRSLLYSLAASVLLGVIGLYFVHRRYSGAALEDDAELVIIEQMVGGFKPTWMDTVTAWCFVVGFVLLVILLSR